MKIKLLFVVCGISIVIGSLGLKERFSQGNQTRRELCRGIGVVKQILLDEHRVKLANSQRYLRRHPDGAPSIDVSRQDLLRAIRAEQKIVRETRRRDCG